MERSLHISRDGQQFGPYKESTAREHLASGALKATDNAWYSGADGWKPLKEVLDGAQSPAPAAPPPPQVAKIRVNRNGQEIGPYTREKAMEYFTAGQLLPTDMAWDDTSSAWKPLNEVLGLPMLTHLSAPSDGGMGLPKGKKIATIFGALVLAAGLIFAGIKYGPGLLGGGKIETPEELAQKTVEALSSNDFEQFNTLTPADWSDRKKEKVIDEVINQLPEGFWETMQALDEDASIEDVQEEIKENLRSDFRSTAEWKEEFSDFLADAEKREGIDWSKVEFVSVDTSSVNKPPFLFPKDSPVREGDIEVIISHNGKRYKIELGECSYLPSFGWFISGEIRWRGEE